MDRYVIREPRGGEYPEGNQMIAFSATSTGNNITIPENIYYRSYGGNAQNNHIQQIGTPRLIPSHVQTYSPNVIQEQQQIVSGVDPRYLAPYADGNAGYIATGQPMPSGPSPMAANIFGCNYQNRKFVGAETGNRNFSSTKVNKHTSDVIEAKDYDLNGPRVNYIGDINKTGAHNSKFHGVVVNNSNFNETGMNNSIYNGAGLNNSNFKQVEANVRNLNASDVSSRHFNSALPKKSFPHEVPKNVPTSPQFPAARNIFGNQQKPHPNLATAPQQQTEVDLLKNEAPNHVKTRTEKLKVAEVRWQSLRVKTGSQPIPDYNNKQILDKYREHARMKKRACMRPLLNICLTKSTPPQTILRLSQQAASSHFSRSSVQRTKELHRSDTRVFSGPVEKILKWHKSIQELGIMVLYEIVGKCVSIRAGETCSKNLVLRDENGPAIQVVYYEIDFFLPELKPPCAVRVVGRMMPGTSRLQAFNVRPATGDDIATLPRRAAVTAHHVAKLAQEYGVEVLVFK